jgi:hypothetical protein
MQSLKKVFLFPLTNLRDKSNEALPKQIKNQPETFSSQKKNLAASIARFCNNSADICHSKHKNHVAKQLHGLKNL